MTPPLSESFGGMQHSRESLYWERIDLNDCTGKNRWRHTFGLNGWLKRKKGWLPNRLHIGAGEHSQGIPKLSSPPVPLLALHSDEVSLLKGQVLLHDVAVATEHVTWLWICPLMQSVSGVLVEREGGGGEGSEVISSEEELKSIMVIWSYHVNLRQALPFLPIAFSSLSPSSPGLTLLHWIERASSLNHSSTQLYQHTNSTPSPLPLATISKFYGLHWWVVDKCTSSCEVNRFWRVAVSWDWGLGVVWPHTALLKSFQPGVVLFQLRSSLHSWSCVIWITLTNR